MPIVRSALLVVFLALPGAQAEPSATGDAESSPKQRLEFAKQAAAEYRFRLSDRDVPEVELHPKPLLRWNNQVVREDDGMLFLWTEGAMGRPVAAAQFFLVESDWHHEFQSLSADLFDVRSPGVGTSEWSWQPKRPGLVFVRADDVDRPLGSASQRLRQMRGIAERFTAKVDTTGEFGDAEQLRLLTTPVYRYSASDQGVLDGAVFAFAQGTNPEVLLVIEADATDPTEKVWRYAFVRMSSFYVCVQRGEQIVWEQEKERVPTPDRTSPYFFRLRAQRDRSVELQVPELESENGGAPSKTE